MPMDRKSVASSASSACPADSGYLVSSPPRLQHHTRVRMLSSKVRAKRKTWLIPASQPVELLFFRAIFSELQKRQHGRSRDACTDDKKISLEAFQIAMERLFFALGEMDGFDARKYDVNGDGSVTWSEFFRVYRETELTINLSLWERVYLTFEHPDSSYLSQFLSNLVLLTIIASSLSFILGTMTECKMDTAAWCRPLKGVELFCLLLFIIEYALRLCTCWAVRPVVGDQAKLLELVVGFEAIPRGHPLRRVLAFLLAPSNLVDAAAILPGLVSRVTQAEGGAFVILRLVRLTRILRAFKSPALSEAVRVISMTMQQSTQALYILAFNLMLGVVIFGSLMYMAEGGPELNAFRLGGTWNDELQAYMRPVDWTWNGKSWSPEWGISDFQSIPEACWWAIVTVTTTGYGDKAPTTVLGKLVGVGTMLFSLVILALPVGVIGGTFSNVWEECDQEKQAQEQQLKRDLKFVAHELSRLEPIVMSRLMLIEVWHDEGVQRERQEARPPASSFMGEAKIQLDIEKDCPCSRICTVPLAPNPEIAKRRISGRITLQYDWTPGPSMMGILSEGSGNGAPRGQRAARTSGLVMPMEPKRSGGTGLQGTLRVTLVSAEGLINLNTHRRGCSSPFCLVLCYPKRDEEVGLPDPSIWRTPTVKENLCPRWGVSHDFEFGWSSKGYKFRHGADGAPAMSMPLGTPRSPSDDPESQQEELLALARDLTEQLHQHKAEARLVQQTVRDLASSINERLGPLATIPTAPESVVGLRPEGAAPPQPSSGASSAEPESTPVRC
mmetsp:Transcript_32830/g.94190  ORF Transcript_32830/g.94190 Transcript_32830/m.94190 type:complete len:784 (-) Transcript_32830:247-2598(-)